MPESINLKKELYFFLFVFVVLTALIYLLLNGGAFWKQARYYIFLNSPWVSADLKNGEILDIKNNMNFPSLAAENYKLIVPKLQINAPIITPKGESLKNILAALEDGVGLYPGSSQIGKKGRGIILGHSSKASWYRGDYATVFAVLDKLEIGDEFYVVKAGQKYTYQVFDKLVLEPREANILFNQKTDISELDLITCWPLGSASKRKIIRAQLIIEVRI